MDIYAEKTIVQDLEDTIYDLKLDIISLKKEMLELRKEIAANRDQLLYLLDVDAMRQKDLEEKNILKAKIDNGEIV